MPGVAVTRRVFFAACPQADALRELRGALSLLPQGLGRKVSAENLHLTLAFAGEVGPHELQCLRASARAVAAPNLSMPLDHWGCFRRAEVLWLGPKRAPPAVRELAFALSEVLAKCGQTPETRAFHPHVTLARRVRRLPAGFTVMPVVWRSTGFALMESVNDGARVRYRVLERYEAAG